MSSAAKSATAAGVSDAWPDGQLQAVPECPVCGSTERRVVHTGLRDRIFFAAPGKWTLWCCSACACGYLDPRPDPGSIRIAYENYFTHNPGEIGKCNQGRLRRALKWLERGLTNRYRNCRDGFRLHPAIPGGMFLLGPVLRRQRELAHDIRHLPAPRLGTEKLLDVGCGNGVFLRTARKLGYDAVGLEFDPQAAAVARRSGFEVIETSVPGSGLPPESFDYVTLNHVIEHLYDPVGALAEIHSLLRPGGRVWIKTPNINAVGHSLYGADWRGLEPPRHLVLFSLEGLVRALRAAGFEEPEIIAPEREAWFYLRQSAAIACNQDPYGRYNPSQGLARKARRLDRAALRWPAYGESITVLAGRR